MKNNYYEKQAVAVFEASFSIISIIINWSGRKNKN